MSPAWQPPEPRHRQTLPQVLARRVHEHGDRVWLVDGERRWRYRDIESRANRLARGLAAQGVSAGDTVLLMLPDCADFVVAWCALARLGAIEVPVNVHLRGGVLAHVLRDSRADIMIVGVGYLDRLAGVAGECDGRPGTLVVHGAGGEATSLPPALAERPHVSFELLLYADDGALPGDGPRHHDLMAVMYTSGTTGPSKGVMVTQVHAYEYARSVIELLEMREDDVYYAPLPLFHIAGQWAVVYAACMRGATVVLPEPFSAASFWPAVRRHGATCCFLLGAMAELLWRQSPAAEDADNPMQRVLVVPLLPDVEAFKRRFGLLVSTTWGSTEVNVPTRSGFELADARTCGRLADDRYEVRIVDADDNEVPDGVPGEAVVRAREPWLLMAGYWNHPEWTVAAWRNLWLHSGDMLMRDTHGNYYFVDRVKDAIRRRGENISSMEVEREIAAHPAVLECGVVPVASEHTEQEVLAVVVLKPGESLAPETLIRFLEPRLAYFAVPRYIDFIDAMPRTQTGKVQKFRLRERGLCESTWDRVAAGVRLAR